ncbi:MAG: cytochrome c biogenesis protein ResB, partial [Clostridia bacterium]|nr:cytochrome c biogenesis protein ResB [Clostridia bacterium]
MSTVKKIWKFIGSMRFAMILLVVLAVACTAGSLITQGQSYAWYAQRYSERTAALILALHLDDAFHSWWFLLIAGFLCVNLLCCNVLRL